eukprot:superscaffoldBa00000703_g6678
MNPSALAMEMQANEALHHQHQVAGNSLLPLLNSGTEPPDQKPVLPIPLDQKPPVSAAELLKDNVASGTGGGGGGGPQIAVVKKEPKSKTPFICGYCNKAFRDSYHLRRHESCHTGIKMVSRPKKTQTAPTMVPLISTVPRENSGNPSYITTVAGILTTATTSTSTGTSVMTPMQHQQQQSIPKKPPKPVKKNHGCDMCGKAFRDVYHLNRHKLSHSDEKPFECPICQQRFKRKDRMTYHVRSHDGGVHKPYICSVCGKGFSRPDHLSCHVKHVHSSERPFKCQVTLHLLSFRQCHCLQTIQHSWSHYPLVNLPFTLAGISDWQWNHSGPRKGELTVGEILNNSFQVLIDNSHKDANNVHNSATTTPVTNSAAITSAVNRSVSASNPVTIAAQMNIATSTVNITSPVNLQHPVTITGPVNLASVNIPTTAHMNIAHPVAITTPMPMNITGPLNIAMRPMESMPFLSQQPHTYASDRFRIAYLLGSFKGAVLAWGSAVWERQSSICFSNEDFTTEMRKVFDHSVRGKDAAKRLLSLRQGSHSIAEFAIEFRTLVTESRWNDKALRGVFQDSLNDSVKDELTSRDDPPDLDQLIALPIRVDNCLWERRREKSARTQHPSPPPSVASRRPLLYLPESGCDVTVHAEPEPMQLGCARLSAEERACRINSQSCLCCGQAGADESFIDRNMAMQLGIETEPLDSGLDAKALNGQLLALVDHKTVPVTLRLSGNHQEVISFHIIDCPRTPLLLGYPWLKTHNPHIDWTMVFSKHLALSLPPHHPYDCAIDLPRAPLPCCWLYNLSQPEREAMEKYIRDSLAAGRSSHFYCF